MLQNYSFSVVGTRYYQQGIISIIPQISEVTRAYKRSDAELSEKYPQGMRLYEYYFPDVSAALVPEPQNEHDPNAIAVYINDTKVGHVPAEMCQNVHALLPAVQSITAKLSGGKYKDIDEGHVFEYSKPYYVDITITYDDTRVARGNSSSLQKERRQAKPRRTWLWVLGWLFIFPLPLTILLLRRKAMKSWLKYGIIALAWVIYLIIAIGISGSSSDKKPATDATVAEKTEPASTTIKDEEAPEKIEETKEPEEPEDTKKALQEALEKEFDQSFIFTKSVRNDTTGRWRTLVYAGSKSMLDYAVEYYNAYFENNNEVHFAINLSLKTTAVITATSDGSMLMITVHEYVDGEEHDAKVLPGGMVLGDYTVDVATGEVTKL